MRIVTNSKGDFFNLDEEFVLENYENLKNDFYDPITKKKISTKKRSEKTLNKWIEESMEKGNKGLKVDGKPYVKIWAFLLEKSDSKKGIEFLGNGGEGLKHLLAKTRFIRLVKNSKQIYIKKKCIYFCTCGYIETLKLPIWNKQFKIKAEEKIYSDGKTKYADIKYTHFDPISKEKTIIVIEIYNTHKTLEINRKGHVWYEIKSDEINELNENNHDFKFNCCRNYCCEKCENENYNYFEKEYKKLLMEINNFKYYKIKNKIKIINEKFKNNLDNLKEKLIIYKNKCKFEKLITKFENLKKKHIVFICISAYKISKLACDEVNKQIEISKKEIQNAIFIKNSNKIILKFKKLSFKLKLKSNINAIKIQRFYKLKKIYKIIFKNIGIEKIKSNFDSYEIKKYIIYPINKKVLLNNIEKKKILKKINDDLIEYEKFLNNHIDFNELNLI